MNKIEAIRKRIEGEAAYKEMRGASQDFLHIKWLLQVVEEMKPVLSWMGMQDCACFEDALCITCQSRALIAKINEEETPNAKR